MKAFVSLFVLLLCFSWTHTCQEVTQYKQFFLCPLLLEQKGSTAATKLVSYEVILDWSSLRAVLQVRVKTGRDFVWD